MKNIVKMTKEVGMLTDQGVYVNHNRPGVVMPGPLVDKKVSKGEVKILGAVNDDATDLDFRGFWEESKGDEALAVESFMAAFPVAKPAAPAAAGEAPKKKK